MDYMQFASDLPLDRTISFGSAEENEEALKRWGVKQDMRQLGAGTFRSDLAVLSTEQAVLYVDRFNRALSMHLESPLGTVGILFPRSASGKFLACGQDVGNRKLIVVPDGSGVDIVIPDLAGSEAITLSKAQFTELTETLSPTDDRPEGLAMIEGNGVRMDALRQAVISLAARPELEPSDEQLSNLLAATIALITNSQSQGARSEGLHTRPARVRIAKLAQEHIEERYHEAIRMEDLCRMTGVGVRSLQRCFREYFDFTITDYLKAVRFNAAHRDLTVAHPSENSIADIALRNGFTHLGRFSTEFRKRFGQSPSETLAMLAGRKS